MARRTGRRTRRRTQGVRAGDAAAVSGASVPGGRHRSLRSSEVALIVNRDPRGPAARDRIADALLRSGERTPATYGHRIAPPGGGRRRDGIPPHPRDFRPTHETGARQSTDRSTSSGWSPIIRRMPTTGRSCGAPLSSGGSPARDAASREPARCYPSAVRRAPPCSPASILTRTVSPRTTVDSVAEPAWTPAIGWCTSRFARRDTAAAGSGSGMWTITDPPRTTASRGSPCRVTDIRTRRPSTGVTSRTRICRRLSRTSRCPESPASRWGRRSSWWMRATGSTPSPESRA